MRHARGVAALILSLWLGACATPQTDRLLEDAASELPTKAEIATVPFFPQEAYYCGPAALAMALAWSGLPVTQQDLVAEVYTPGKEGSLRSDVMAAARRHGRLAVRVSSLQDLLAEVAVGHPVLVFQNLGLSWYPQWHYAVAIGYDIETEEIMLHSGLNAHYVTSLGTFEQTWERGDHWGLVVLPAGRLPAGGDQIEILHAASGLEKVGRHAEAVAAYRSILRKWPKSFPASMGLGNAYYAAKNFPAAEDAFRRAITVNPEDPAPWNNLAYVLASQGRNDDAIDAAKTAVRLAPAAAESFRKTLEEVSAL